MGESDGLEPILTRELLMQAEKRNLLHKVGDVAETLGDIIHQVHHSDWTDDTCRYHHTTTSGKEMVLTHCSPVYGSSEWEVEYDGKIVLKVSGAGEPKDISVYIPGPWEQALNYLYKNQNNILKANERAKEREEARGERERERERKEYDKELALREKYGR
jgi:hypothetical protein